MESRRWKATVRFAASVHAGVIIAGDNLTAVDATATRVMGLYPERVKHLRMMTKHGGVIGENRITQVGEKIAESKQDFRVIDDFRYLKQAPTWITNLIDAI